MYVQRSSRDATMRQLRIESRPATRARSATRLLRRAALLAVLLAGFAATSAHASVSMCNVPITMSDGVVLRADVFLPSPSGRFPTALTVTGYNLSLIHI